MLLDFQLVASSNSLHIKHFSWSSHKTLFSFSFKELDVLSETGINAVVVYL